MNNDSHTRMQPPWCLSVPAQVVRALALGLAALLACNQAVATLGQVLPPPTIASPSTAPASSTAAARMNAAVPAAKSSLYTVRNTLLDSGTMVSEYATPAGLVFAISWQGPTLPDLQALLGSYFSTFKDQADASRSTRSLGAPLQVNAAGLVVRSSGRMRNFSGHAYAPSLVPNGVTISDVLP